MQVASFAVGTMCNYKKALSNPLARKNVGNIAATMPEENERSKQWSFSAGRHSY